MRFKLIFLLMLLFGSFAEPVWASDAATSTAPAATAAISNQATASAIPKRGTLYRVRYQGHTSYLFGTIHVGRPDFFPFEEQATEALNQAGTLVLEVDMRNTASIQNAVQEYGIYANNDTLDQHLSAAGLAHLKQALTQAGIPYEGVAHMKPWMVADFLSVAGLEKQGYHTDQGTDLFLLSSAVAQGKTIQELESVSFQLSLFADMTEKQQEQFLDETLDDMQSGLERKKTQELIDAWATADEKAFDDLLHDAQNDHSVTGKFFYDILLAKRNPAMAAKIEALLKNEPTSFVGVGLLHLIGRDGVPRLLARRGYEVTRLY